LVVREFAFEKPDVPEVRLVQVGDPEVAPVTVPVTVATGLFRQTLKSVPALTVGVGTARRMILSFTGLQFPLLILVKNKPTIPREASAGDKI
jgi:hypothetical protein